MKRLILMRHAKSDWSAGAGDDHGRPLNARGRQSAAALGDWLRAEGLTPDQLLCSTAMRTRETYARLELGGGADETFTRDLYLAPHPQMLASLRGATGHVVMMLGHNPGCAITARMLLAAPPEHAKFDSYPTGAMLVAEFDVEGWKEVDWGLGRCLHFIVPRDLSGGVDQGGE